MSSTAGRATRVVAIIAGIMAGGGWLVLITVGALPLATGLLDVCLSAPLAKRPFKDASTGPTPHTAGYPRRPAVTQA